METMTDKKASFWIQFKSSASKHTQVQALRQFYPQGLTWHFCHVTVVLASSEKKRLSVWMWCYAYVATLKQLKNYHCQIYRIQRETRNFVAGWKILRGKILDEEIEENCHSCPNAMWWYCVLLKLQWPDFPHRVGK